MNQPNPHLSDLLRNLSFTAHTLNNMLSLAHDAGHSTRELEHIIHLIERELQIIRTAMRRRAEAEAEAENAPSTYVRPDPERFDY